MYEYVGYMRLLGSSNLAFAIVFSNPVLSEY